MYEFDVSQVALGQNTAFGAVPSIQSVGFSYFFAMYEREIEPFPA